MYQSQPNVMLPGMHLSPPPPQMSTGLPPQQSQPFSPNGHPMSLNMAHPLQGNGGMYNPHSGRAYPGSLPSTPIMDGPPSSIGK